MGVIKFDRDFSTLFNWDTDENPTTEQDYQNAVKNWTETEMNIVDTLLWQPTTEYATGNIVKTPSLPSQYVLRCAEAGTSGSTEPDYSGASVGDTVTDGSVEWVIVSLATGNAADVDAGNIGVNAEVDNSEAWGNAIGGGAIAEDDGRLVTGDTVYAVTSVMETNIATNTEAIEDNTEAIATNTADITQNTTDIDIADKRISNIEKLLQGNLYDYQTDTDSKYTKTVPQGAMPYASLEQIGGKTLVWNSKRGYNFRNRTINGVTFTYADGVETVSGSCTSADNYNFFSMSCVVGHKYYINMQLNASTPLLAGTSFNCGSFGGSAPNSFVFNATTTSQTCTVTLKVGAYDFSIEPRLADLTLMFGSGNEPTAEEFEVMFPNFANATENAGTLLSAGVTEVKSVGKNMWNSNDLWLATSSGVTINSADSITVVTTPYQQNLNKYYLDGTAGQYTISLKWKCTIIGNHSATCRVGFEYTDGTHSIHDMAFASVGQTGTLTATSTVGKIVDHVSFGYWAYNGAVDLTNIQLEKSATATTYSPYKKITYPIPAEIQALEGYGWSAGTVFNYIDYERKVFVKNVGAVDLGTLIWTYNNNVYGQYFSTLMDTKKDGLAGFICAKYETFGAGIATITSSTGIAQSEAVLKAVYVVDPAYNSANAFKSAVSGVYAYYELATPIEVDISAYLTDDNLISVESGGTLTFPNSNGTDYQIPVPSAETYMVDLQASL